MSVLDALLEAFAPPNAGPLVAPKETPAQSQAIAKRQVAQAGKDSAAFDAKHPRARGGKFTTKGGHAARARGYRGSGGRARKASGSQQNVLTVGASGALVRAVQRQLGVAVSGSYDERTKEVVTRFQRQRGLLVDGIVGRQTLAALRGDPHARSVTPGPIASRSARLVAPAKRTAKKKAGKQSLALTPGARFQGGVVV